MLSKTSLKMNQKSVFSFVTNIQYFKCNLDRKRIWKMMLGEYFLKTKTFNFSKVLNLSVVNEVVVIDVIDSIDSTNAIEE